LNRSLSGAPATGNQQIEQSERWKSRWLSHSENQRRFDAREERAPGRGQAFLNSEFLTAQSQSWLAGQTNNHIVRHRLVILERLVRDIVAEPIFCNGQAERIGRVAIEVARDILTFSGKQRTGKSGIVSTLDSMRKHHEHVRRKLEKDLSDTQWKNSINGELIWKAKIADDLGWKCPYTGQPFCACDLASGKMDVDHIIPKSKRLTDAMGALIVTYKAINNMKGDLTAREFVEQFQGQRIEDVNQPIRQLWDYERFVKNPDNQTDKLRLSGETGHKDYARWPRFLPGTKKAHPDYIRRKKRRMYLLIKHFEKDKEGFQPRDLTITSHLNRLSQQVLLRCLPGLPVHHITSIPGSVTGTLRDARGWHLLGCLDGAASMDVMRMKRWKNPQTKKVEEIRVAKPKGEIRELTHLHHALDACVIGIVSNLLPKDGKLWELVAKGELNEADVKAFENLRDKFLKQCIRIAKPI
jgi:CRISPR-associated endonuclease Csn1